MGNLKEMGLVELDNQSLKETEGGIIGAIVAGLIIAASAEIISDWDNFERGFTGQPYKE